jgi:hypothetical protein
LRKSYLYQTLLVKLINNLEANAVLKTFLQQSQLLITILKIIATISRLIWALVGAIPIRVPRAPTDKSPDIVGAQCLRPKKLHEFL